MSYSAVSYPAPAAEAFEPSERVRELITSVVPPLLQRAGTRGLVALTVVGSAARGEETWDRGRLAGDIDLAAVVRSPGLLTMRRLARAARGLEGGIQLGFFPLYSLSRYRTLEFYEAKRTGWVLWGQADVFDRVRIDRAQDIPKWEALRLLFNRAMECVRARAGLSPSWYAAVKSYLALGEADLVFSEQYEPSYRGRLKRLEAAGHVLGSQELLERVRWATHLKLGAPPPEGPLDEYEHERRLLDGLTLLLTRYLDREVTLMEGLERVSEKTRHMAHRVAYLTRHRRSPQRWASALRRDPIFSLWECAFRLLRGEIWLPDGALHSLVTDWEHTHQPLPE